MKFLKRVGMLVLLLVLAFGVALLLRTLKNNTKDNNEVPETQQPALSAETVPAEQEKPADPQPVTPEPSGESAEPSVPDEPEVTGEPAEPTEDPGTTVEPEPEPEPEPVAEIVDPTVSTSYSVLCESVDSLVAAYPELLQRESYGTSVMGRDLILLKMGTGSKKILVVGGIHAREHLTVAYLLKSVEDILSAQASGGRFGEYDVSAMLEEYTVYVVPNCNPDGSEACIRNAEVNFEYTMNRKYMCANANGVNLNYNFPFIWAENKGGVSYPSEWKYKGKSAGSEPETQALMALCDGNRFLCMLDVHISGKFIYWRDETNGEIPGDEFLAKRLSRGLGFTMTGASFDKNSYGGGFENWFRSAYGVPGICVELEKQGWNDRELEREDPQFYKRAEYDTTKYLIPLTLKALSDPDYSAAVELAAQARQNGTSGTGTATGPEEPRKMTRKQNIVDPFMNPDYEILCSVTDQLAEFYPEIIRKETYGTSVQGRDLILLKVGSGEKKVLFVAGIHAREHMTVAYMLKCLEDYAAAWAGNGKFGSYDMRALLEEYTVYIVPNANPDGSEACINNTEVNFNYANGRVYLQANANGVNLNYNFPFIWEENNSGVNRPSEWQYKGPSEASEPETQALIALCDSEPFECLIDIHIAGKYIYWQDETNGEIPGDDYFAHKLAGFLGYHTPGASFNRNSYGGGFENWFRSAYNKPGLCVEISKTGWNERVLEKDNPYFNDRTEYSVTKYMLPEVLTILSSTAYEDAVAEATARLAETKN